MFDFIRTHQMNIMLALCAICAMMAVLLVITRFLPKRRKWILIGMELVATFLLGFDRLAYIYSGNVTVTGFIMVRLSNFMVFFMTSGIVFCFNLYLIDMLSRIGISKIPVRLTIVGFASIIGMLLAILTLFTGLYYSFDEYNVYHRGPGFLIAYLVPVVCPLIQFSVIQKFRKKFSRFIYIALLLYIFVPIIVGIIQIFTYGISIVNMAMVLVSVSLYIFTYLDINDEVERAHNLEMENLREEQKSMKVLFSQTANAFVTAVEKRDPFMQGHSKKMADVARLIAQRSGMSEDECDEAYYAAYLFNAGVSSLPDSLLEKEVFTTDEERILKNLPEVSSEILSKIKEYPYLSQAAKYSTEHYDGTGYPEGLKGEEIPAVARIVAIADAFGSLTIKKKYRNPLPDAVVREEFIKGSGLKYDPKFASIMVQLLDSGIGGKIDELEGTVESELCCTDYRENHSTGIPVLVDVTKITFNSTELNNQSFGASPFSAPSIVLFDSFDCLVHDNKKSIEAYRYLEYGELWFDGHNICTSARNMESSISVNGEDSAFAKDPSLYEIIAGRYEDHIFIQMRNKTKCVKVIAALPDSSKSVYIALTGENCHLSGIKIEKTGSKVGKNEIPRIAEQISFINRIEADIPNVQIDSTRSASTDGIKIKDFMIVSFHTMSMPESNFVWHCPYVVIFYSEDGKIGGKDYREYAMVKLNGEDNFSNDFSENRFVVKKNNSFHSWDEWKERNKAGIECEIVFEKKGNSVTFTTENLGIAIENTSVIRNGPKEVYVALTGDQCALTDIRIR